MGSSGVPITEVVGLLPLMNEVFIGHSVAIVIVLPSSDFEVVESDASGESAQVIDGVSLVGKETDDFLGVLVVFLKNFRPGHSWIVTAV